MTVCDSSAIYKAVKSARVEKLSGQHTSSLAFYELGNIIWKNCVVHKVYTSQEAFELIGFCESALEKMRISYSDMGHVYKIAAKHHISFYDSIYVCLALELRFPLVTIDNKLSQKAKSIVDILSFEEFIEGKI